MGHLTCVILLLPHGLAGPSRIKRSTATPGEEVEPRRTGRPRWYSSDLFKWRREREEEPVRARARSDIESAGG
jgi:hypothetical protein